jgi:succinate dehydrogenase / fumarate reductase membrane anchor subunit
MSLRTPLAIARNHGSAHDGVHHWWQQRLTAMALVPLLLWLVCAVVTLSQVDYVGAKAWLSQPLNATLSVLLTWVMAIHARLGVQVILEDYVSTRWQEILLQILTRFIAFAGAAAASLFIVMIAAGR